MIIREATEWLTRWAIERLIDVLEWLGNDVDSLRAALEHTGHP